MRSIVVSVCMFVAMQSYQTAALARGFCNVDHYGDDKNREEARDAAAQFYDGAAKLMQTLAAFERSDETQLRDLGKQAISDLESSAGKYASASGLYKANPGDGVAAFDALDPSTIAVMAMANGDALSAIANGSASPDVLLAKCSEEAKNVAAAVGGFVDKPMQELKSEDFSVLLEQLSNSLAFGRVISAGFAYASGERPKP